jgi:hypothetical protein
MDTDLKAQAGRGAASKGDLAQAWKCFSSLKQCGTVLDHSEYLILVQLTGKEMKSKANPELARIGL